MSSIISELTKHNAYTRHKTLQPINPNSLALFRGRLQQGHQIKKHMMIPRANSKESHPKECPCDFRVVDEHPAHRLLVVVQQLLREGRGTAPSEDQQYDEKTGHETDGYRVCAGRVWRLGMAGAHLHLGHHVVHLRAGHGVDLGREGFARCRLLRRHGGWEHRSGRADAAAMEVGNRVA
jgi:hypothetical protein